MYVRLSNYGKVKIRKHGVVMEKPAQNKTTSQLEDGIFPKDNNGGQTHSDTGENIYKSIRTILFAAIFAATAFTMWTPENILSNQLLDRMMLALQSSTQFAPTSQTMIATDRPAVRSKVGIVAGHWGNDSGAVCQDGLTEVDVNLNIATLVRQNLMVEGYDVDLLGEYDQRLYQYEAQALVSIHNDSCMYINDEATGFKVAAARSTTNPEIANRLTACLINRYMQITKLSFHANTITPDMSDYHAFGEVSPETPSVIIETGFLNLDRQILTEEPELIAEGVTSGILCFLRNEPISVQDSTLTP